MVRPSLSGDAGTARACIEVAARADGVGLAFSSHKSFEPRDWPVEWSIPIMGDFAHFGPAEAALREIGSFRFAGTTGTDSPSMAERERLPIG